MKTIKIAEATPLQIDYLVAKEEGYTDWCGETEKFLPPRKEYGYVEFSELDYSTNPAQGHPILEREGINFRAIRKEGHALHGMWLAAYDHGNTGTMVRWVKREDWHKHYLIGPTMLIAGLRCFLVSRLGEIAEIPEELA